MSPPTHQLDTQLLRVDELRPHPRNARNGDVDAIVESLRINGQYRPIVVARGGVILAGNHTYAAAHELGWDELAAVQLDIDPDSAEARRIMLADNRTADLGGYDEGLLLDLLRSLDEDLLGTGYVPDDLDDLVARTTQGLDGMERAAEVETGDAMPARKRTLPLDVILSINAGPSFAEAQAGIRLGWQPGVISDYVTAARAYYRRYPRAPRLAFMDNPWHGYDHEQHLAAVAEMRPKYATTRDLLTREQAAEAKVEYLSLTQVLDQAAEIAEHCEHVILIPKYQCLDKLPESIDGTPVVLGYSVQSSYGGTAVPIKAFAGRPIHLLGGPWKKQRAYLNLMGEDVVSLDNNHVMSVARYAQVVTRSGEMTQLDELLGHHVHSPYFPALVLSCANIASAVVEEYGVALEPIGNGPDEEDV